MSKRACGCNAPVGGSFNAPCGWPGPNPHDSPQPTRFAHQPIIITEEEFAEGIAAGNVTAEEAQEIRTKQAAYR